MVLFCKIHYLVVHGASLVQSRCPGAPEGGIVKKSFPIVRDKNILDKQNALEGSKMMFD